MLVDAWFFSHFPILWSFSSSYFIHLFILDSISQCLLFSQSSQSFRLWKKILFSCFVNNSLWTQGVRWSSLNIKHLITLLYISNDVVYNQQFEICNRFSKRQFWWKCQHSNQRQLLECSLRNPDSSLFSSHWVFSSSIVRGHCHLVEKILRGLDGYLGKQG